MGQAYHIRSAVESKKCQETLAENVGLQFATVWKIKYNAQCTRRSAECLMNQEHNDELQDDNDDSGGATCRLGGLDGLLRARILGS
jgi:hypothetical protein